MNPNILMYWSRTELPSSGPPHERASPNIPWELRNLVDRGFCAFALKDYKAGELILIESPTVWSSGHHPFSSEQIREIEERVSALPSDDQQAFYAMANVYPEVKSRCAGIFMTNSFDMVDSPQGEACAMYCAIARLNHSCVPNVQQTHCPNSGKEVLYASRDIAAGEEMCDCYIDLRQNRRARRQELLQNYRFVCRCPACGDDDDDDNNNDDNDNSSNVDDEDDMARVRAGLFEDHCIDAVAEGDLERGLSIALEGLSLLESPRHLKWSVRYIAAAHVLVYQITEELGMRSLARKHIQLAHQYNVRLQGPNTPDSMRTAELRCAGLG